MNLLITSLLGGLFVSDTVAIGQFMISRPIFCGPVIGLILGDVTAGLYAGMIMELIWINVVPLGNVVPPDATVVTVSVTYLAATMGGSEKGYLVFLILCLVPVGILFKKLDIMHRDFNSFFVHKLDEKLAEGDISYIDKVVYFSVALFILKGIAFLLAVMWIGEKIFPYIYSLLGSSLRESLSEVFYIIPSVGLGVAITVFLFKQSPKRKVENEK